MDAESRKTAFQCLIYKSWQLEAGFEYIYAGSVVADFLRPYLRTLGAKGFVLGTVSRYSQDIHFLSSILIGRA